jgi:TPR repeat protein
MPTDPVSIFRMGLCHEHVLQDSKSAFVCYQQAAEAKLPQAFYRLGLCCELGKGTAYDLPRAYELYKEGAGLNCLDAKISQALCL